MDVVFYVCIVRCGAVGTRVWKCECFVCLCLVCILWQFSNTAFCMTCSLLMLVDDARGDHMEEAYSRVCLMTAL